MRDHRSIQNSAAAPQFAESVLKTFSDDTQRPHFLPASLVRRLKFFVTMRFFSSSQHRFLTRCSVVIFTSLQINLNAQFMDVTNEYGIYIEGNGVSEGGVSFHDFNRDGLDDLTFATDDNGVYTYINTGNGFEPVYYFAGLTGFITHPIWVDYDNDDDADFFATRPHDCLILYRNDGDMTFTDVSTSLPCISENVISYCATWGDYDNDAFLDVFVGNYAVNGVGTTSWLYHNNGDGSFTELATEIGVDNGINPVYQSMWIDFDQDMDQDLLVVNDRYQGCKLYQNNGGSSFTNIADEVGFNVYLNAMSLSVSDFDHDEDFDFYISNTTQGNVFLRNEDGMFVDRAAELNAQVNASCWGSVFVDVEGSGWEDLYVVSTGPIVGQNVLLKNEAGVIFSEDYTTFQGLDADYRWATAKGDCNDDGYYDILSTPYLPVGPTLFQNQPSGENWVKISLQGIVSNHDAVGSIIKVYAGDVVYTKALTCGENFVSQDSQHLIFGIGAETTVDSLTVRWPSGWMDKHMTLPSNQSYVFVEGSNFSDEMEVHSTTMCFGDSVLLNPGSWSAYLWQNGAQSENIMAYSSGIYSVEVSNEFGLTKVIFFDVVVEQIPMYEIIALDPSCYGQNDGVISLQTTGENVIFSINEMESPLTASGLSAGIFSLSIETAIGCSVTEEWTLNEPPILSIQTTTSEGCFGEEAPYNIAVLGAQGGAELFGITNFSGQLVAGNYPFLIMDGNGCSAMDTLRITTADAIAFAYLADSICLEQVTTLDYSISGGLPPYEWMNASVNPQEMTCGVYEISISDSMNCLSTFIVEIHQHPAMVVSSIVSPPISGNDGFITLDIQGGTSPFSVQWNTEDTGLILSNLDAGIYDCLIEDAHGCVAHLEQIVVPLEIHESTTKQTFVTFREEQLVINSFSSFEYVLWDIQGRLWMSGRGSGFTTIPADQLARGHYVIGVNQEFFKIAVP